MIGETALFKNEKRHPRRPARFVSYLLFAALLVSILYFKGCRSSDINFNQRTWLAWTKNDDEDNPRYFMVDDLRANYLKMRMTKAQVEALLGEPDFSKSKAVYSYTLGMWSGFRVDYASLDLSFDKDGRLIKMKTVEH